MTPFKNFSKPMSQLPLHVIDNAVPNNVLVKSLTGSHLYGTELEKSEKDYIAIFVNSNNNLEKQWPRTIKIGNTWYYELQLFADMLLNGDLAAHKVLWTDHEQYLHLGGKLSYLKDIRKNLITSSILRIWLEQSKQLFDKSLGFGQLKSTPKNLLSFLNFSYSIINGLPEVNTLFKAFSIGKLDPHGTTRSLLSRNFALSSTELGPNMYALFEDSSSLRKPQVRGIIDDFGGIIDHEYTKAEACELNYRGIVYFDKPAFDKYQNIKKVLETTDIARNYATKSMYLAYMYIYCVVNFISTGKLNIKAANKEFLMDIRKGEKSLEELVRLYEMEHKAAVALVERVNTLTETTDEQILKDIVFKIRN